MGAGCWWGWGHWWEWGDGGGGVRGGMGSLVGPLLSTLTFIAETTLERRDHAGVLAAAAPKTACSVETTLACRDHGAGGIFQAVCDSSVFSGLLMPAWVGGPAAMGLVWNRSGCAQ